MKCLYTYFLILLFPYNLLAQTVQPGLVLEYNERHVKTPLGNVEIIISNASSTISDELGNFLLQFRTSKPGDKVNVRRIEKIGFEVFNKEALEQWFISREKYPFSIIMCRSDRFKKIRDNYSRVSSASYEKQLANDEAKLALERKEGRMKDLEYQDALKKLYEEYDRQLNNLDNYVDRFARIDLSELSKVEADIIELVQRGEIEHAIQLYEQQNLEEKYLEQVSVARRSMEAIDVFETVKKQSYISRDSIFSLIKRKNETLSLAGGKEKFEKIGNGLKEIALSDTTYIEAVWEYSQFSYKQAIYDDAITFLSIYIRASQDESRLIHAYIQMADSYRKLKRFDDAYVHANKALIQIRKMIARSPDVSRKLLAKGLSCRSLVYFEINKLSEAEKDMLEAKTIYEELINTEDSFIYIDELSKILNNLGNLYRRLRHFDKAEEFMVLSLQYIESLYSQNPRKYLFDLASTRNNLGLIYKTVNMNEQARICYSQAIKDMSRLLTYNPNAYREEYFKYLNNMAVFLKNTKRYEEAEKYSIATIKQADTLFLQNKEAYASYLGSSLLNIGNLYIKMKRYEEAKNNIESSLPIITELYKRSKNAFSTSLLSAYIALGNVCVAMKEYVDAEIYYMRALELGEFLYQNNPDAFILEYYLSIKNLGITNMYLDNTEKAEHYIVKALNIIEKLYLDSPNTYIGEVISLKYILGDFYQVNGDVKRACNFFKEALILCNENEEKFHERILSINKRLNEMEHTNY